MSETRVLTCIGCPMGCRLTVSLEEGAVTAVTGNTCRRGDAYARREVTAPTRVLTTTVRVTGGMAPVVAVKTIGEVPKELVLSCARALRSVKVPAPVAAVDIIYRDILGTGVDVAAVGDVPTV